MIQYKFGDLIALAQEGAYKAIGQQCNCYCRMGRGIAPLIALAFPEAEVADNETKIADYYKLGTFSKGIHDLSNEKSLHVYNLYGQYHWTLYEEPYGGNTNYLALEKALRLMRDDILLSNSKELFLKEPLKVALPYIGCGLAGGEWNIVSKLIIDTFSKYQEINLDIVIKDKNLFNKLNVNSIFDL